MKLLYLIAGTYRPAGMERVLAQKVNWLAQRRTDAGESGVPRGPGEPEFSILIATTDQRGQEDAFKLDPAVRKVDLGINYEENNGASFLNKVLKYPFKQRRHRKALAELLRAEKPDVVVSMFCNDASFLPGLVKRQNKRTGSSMKTVLEYHFTRDKRKLYGRRGIWALADDFRSRQDYKLVQKFDKFVVLTQEDKGYWGPMPNIEAIPNARTFTFDKPSQLANRQVIAVGRYCHQKGFDRLLEAWKKMDTAGWTLRIAGSGEAMGELPENVITGPSADMKSEYLNSSIIAMTSRYEGLPMVLLEAQAAGLPAVAMACKCGPKDVITDGVDGYLVAEGDVEAFAERLQTLMADEDLRKNMGAAAYKASERFAKEEIMQRWLQLFRDLCAR